MMPVLALSGRRSGCVLVRRRSCALNCSFAAEAATRLRNRFRRNPAAHAPSPGTCSAFVRSISAATPTSLLRAGSKTLGPSRHEHLLLVALMANRKALLSDGLRRGLSAKR